MFKTERGSGTGRETMLHTFTVPVSLIAVLSLSRHRSQHTEMPHAEVWACTAWLLRLEMPDKSGTQQKNIRTFIKVISVM